MLAAVWSMRRSAITLPSWPNVHRWITTSSIRLPLGRSAIMRISAATCVSDTSMSSASKRSYFQAPTISKNSVTWACPRRGSSHGTPAACGVQGSSVTSHVTSSERCDKMPARSPRPNASYIEATVSRWVRVVVVMAEILEPPAQRRNGPFGLSSDQPVLDGEHCGASAGAPAGLVVDRGKVILHGARRDDQRGGDLLVRQSTCGDRKSTRLN